MAFVLLWFLPSFFFDHHSVKPQSNVVLPQSSRRLYLVFIATASSGSSLCQLYRLSAKSSHYRHGAKPGIVFISSFDSESVTITLVLAVTSFRNQCNMPTIFVRRTPQVARRSSRAGHKFRCILIVDRFEDVPLSQRTASQHTLPMPVCDHIDNNLRLRAPVVTVTTIPVPSPVAAAVNGRRFPSSLSGRQSQTIRF